MNNDDRSGLLYLLAGIGLGTLIGAVLGLLFAPKAGSELRGDINERVHELGERVKDLTEKARERSGDTLRNVRQRLARSAEAAAEEIAPDEA
ncbi:MAG: YtxH domain-containing protein [Fimbriimonadia bacterium]|nr:YtxH domain-containing protein [Fimbriimonadia bacterium]